MTGWRLGWMVVPDDLVAPSSGSSRTSTSARRHVSQVAGLAAFDCQDELDGHVAPLRRATARCCSTGWPPPASTDVADADGAFYVYADVSHTARTDGSTRLALCRTGSTSSASPATPGIDFDLARGDRFVRFSYAGGRRHRSRLHAAGRVGGAA